MNETLSKYCQETSEDRAIVEEKVKAYAKSMGTSNLDVAAFLFVKEQNKVPPPMKVAAAPFVVLEKEYIPLKEVDIKTFGEGTGFNVRGYVLSKRINIVRSSGKPMCALMITDCIEARDVLYFGEQVEKVDKLIAFPTDRGTAIMIKNVQCKWNKQDPTKWGLSVSGYYSETLKIGEHDFGLPGKAGIANMNPTKTAKELKQREAAIIRVRALSAENKPYVGCPSCKKKITDNIPAGRMTICPSEKSSCAGSQVVSASIDRFRMTGFDDTGEVKLSFGFGDSFVPMETLQDYASRKATVLVAGQLNDSGEFDTVFLLPVTGEVPKSEIFPTLTANALPSPVTTTTPVPITAPPTTMPKTVQKTPVEIALSALRVIGPLTKDAFITNFLVGKKGIPLADAQSIVIDLLESGKVVLTGDSLRIA